MTITYDSRISIQAGDFGLNIPFDVLCYGEETLEPEDVLTFTVEDETGAVLVTRACAEGDITPDGSFSVALTEAETQALKVGLYRWKITLQCGAASQSAVKGPGFFEVRR